MPRLAAAVIAMMTIAGTGAARAQDNPARDYPTRTVTVIVPFAAGGPADITGRIVADIFSRYLGQKFVVENVGGAGGTTGTLRAARSPADGYTILSRQQSQGICGLREVQSGQAQCRTCRAWLGILYRLPASSRRAWHQADNDSIHRHGPGPERDAGRPGRL